MQRNATGGSGVTYRPDIDGMRAVAVLLVVLNHLRTRFTGGYIGVDVFFVISGYLISSTILSEMDRGSFSIIRFYERRIRRIFPAMLALYFVVAILALLFFVPSEVQACGTSILAALFSVSNFLFWSQAGYFDAPSLTKPLLHTWSLAVEEQFYIAFPIFLLMIHRWFPARMRQAIWAAAWISFGLAWYCVRRDASTAFFLAPFRAWELLVGTIISQRYLPSINTVIGRNIASLTGLLCIFIPAVLYSSETPFPGPAALPPCLGAALIIAAGETGTSLVGRILGLRPIVFIGLISYSFYLWHWPMIVFQHTSALLLHAQQADYRVRYVVFVASFIAAVLSWKFIETPFRVGRLRPGRRTLFCGAGIAVALVAVAAVLMASTGGFSSRFPPDAIAVARYASFDPAKAYRQGVCFIDPPETFSDFNPKTCLSTDASRKQFLLLGDSHAADLYPGLVTEFPEFHFLQANSAGCRPFLTEPPKTRSDCVAMSKYIYQDFLPSHKVDAVMISVRWEDPDVDVQELRKTIDYVRGLGMRVILFGPGIEYDAPMPRIVAIALRDKDPSEIERHRHVIPQGIDRQMAELAREWNVTYISTYDDLCSSHSNLTGLASSPWDCPVYAGPDIPLLFDSDHLTPEGSILLAKALRNRGQL